MESPSTWPERSIPITRNLAIQELTDGEVWRDKLLDILHHPETDSESVRQVIGQFMRVFCNTLKILKSSDFNQFPLTPVTRSQDTRSSPGSWDDPKSIDFGVRVRTPVKPKRGRYTRDGTREEFHDTFADDGFAWRKYGQKTILNSKHQKSYYRCTHKEQGCEATKQVQMTDEEVPRFKTTYQGHHTCDTKSQGAYHNILEASSPTTRSFSIDFITNKGATRINDKVETGFPPDEGYPSLGRRLTYNHQISSDHPTSWDPSFGHSQVSSAAMVMMPYDDLFPSTSRGIHGHEMDGEIIGSFVTFPI